MVAYCSPSTGVWIIDRTGYCARSVEAIVSAVYGRVVKVMSNVRLDEVQLLEEASMEITSSGKAVSANLVVPMDVAAGVYDMRPR